MSLSDQNIGWEVVEKRIGEYKNWDPDIIKADKDTENGYWRRLEERGTPFKFLNPNGGPYGFVDVAEGKIDCYFAPKQPFVDIFSGIYIAEQAGVVVTDFDGNPVQFVPDEETVWDVVATTNQALHDQVLAGIAECKKKM